MSTIVWTTLITAVATVSASLGAVWIKSHFDDRSQARQAAETRTAAQDDRRLEAYGELVKTARLALRNFRQLVLAYAANTPEIPAVNEAFAQAASLAAGMNQAAALAELAAPPGLRKQVRTIYDKAKECADFFQFHELFLAAASDTPVGKLFAGMYPGGFQKAGGFNVKGAEALCDALEAAIDQFIDTVNTDG